MQQKWKLTRENLSEIREEVKRFLQSTKADEREIRYSALLLEEVAVELFEQEEKEIQVSLKKRFGNIFLELSQCGQEFNPLVLMDEWDQANVEKDARHNIFCANRMNLSYHRKNGRNSVMIQVHEFGQKMIWLTLLMSVLGILCGIVLRSLCSDSMIGKIDENVFSVIKNLFMSALKMMIAPVVFFSITASISSLTNLSEVGKMAGKMIFTYTITTIVASVAGMLIGFFIFQGSVPMVVSGAEVGQVETTGFSFKNLIEGLVPNDLVTPIQNGEMMQIVVVSVLVGFAISILGEKIKLIRDFIDEANTLCMRIITLVMKFIPLVAFCSLASMTVTMGRESLTTALKFFGALLIGIGCMVFLYAMIVLVFGKMTPLPLLKKVVPYMLTPFSTTSSSACIPASLELCEKKLGIDSSVSSFTIPIGATINMDGGGVYFGIATILYAKMFGVPISFSMLLNALLLIVVLTIGTPGVPGANLVCISMILSSFGIPLEAMAFLIGINALADMMITTCNVTGDIAATTMIAASEGKIDKEVYRR